MEISILELWKQMPVCWTYYQSIKANHEILIVNEETLHCSLKIEENILLLKSHVNPSVMYFEAENHAPKENISVICTQSAWAAVSETGLTYMKPYLPSRSQS